MSELYIYDDDDDDKIERLIISADNMIKKEEMNKPFYMFKYVESLLINNRPDLTI